MLEAYPLHFHAQRPTTSSSIYSGENYKVQSIQMYPTRLNTSWPDKQLLLCVTAATGKLRLKDGLWGGQARSGEASRDENIFQFMEIVTLFLVWVRFSWCCSSSRSFGFFWRLNFVSGCSQIFHNETAESVAPRWKIYGKTGSNEQLGVRHWWNRDFCKIPNRMFFLCTFLC